MSMHDPKQVIGDLAYLIPKIYSALDYGTTKAKGYFDKEGVKSVDPYLGPNIVRWHAIRSLKEAGEDAFEEFEDNEVSLNTVPNNGIYITAGKYHVRVLKSNNGELPVPGHSKSRQQYYYQYPLVYDTDLDGEEESNINLVILWDVDKDYGLDMLSIACPKSGGSTRESVTAHWQCKIPTNILYGEYDIEAGIKDEDIYDLDLGEDINEETGTE